ncbi:MAG: endolytic transglycosylase MltG [Arcobacter butzleri]|nr:endolytic transglycosylase MltG [Aliarcobacter butzleri]
MISVILISLLFYLSINVYSSRIIFIPQGSTNTIISYLSKSGYELNMVDSLYMRFFLGYPQSGWIDLKSNKMTKGDFLYQLTTSKAALKQVTLIPGETYFDFFNKVSLELDLSYDRLIDVYDGLKFRDDGNILAETYSIPIGMDEQYLVYYLINHSQRKYSEVSKKIFGSYNQDNWYSYLIVASIIQKEAANIEEMPLVASVIYNRLKNSMPLQMDGTLKYGEFSKRAITPAIIQNDESRYNTYKYKGLPEHPICNVSLTALISAIKPKNTEFLYFVRDKTTKTHIFSKTYREHINNINYTKQQESYVKTLPKEQYTNDSSKIHTKNNIEPSVLDESTKPIDIKALFDSIK